MPTATDVKFSHVFSGISVWIEPDSTQTTLLTKEMDHLMQKCGGRSAGMHHFVPHCTLLYNTSFPSELCKGVEQHDNDTVEAQRRIRQEQVAEELLAKCLAVYYTRADKASDTRHSNIQLKPNSHYYFPYPITADNGKGFGCAISLLILETTPELQLLQEVVKRMFPPDERHRLNADNLSSINRGDGDSRTENEVASTFRPHMALVYAPENHENVTNGWLENYTTQMESEKRYLHWIESSADAIKDGIDDDVMEANKLSDSSKASWNAKYLSIWSTEGTLDEWYRIARVDLIPSNDYIL